MPYRPILTDVTIHSKILSNIILQGRVSTLSQYMSLLSVLCCIKDYQADDLNIARVHTVPNNNTNHVSQGLNLRPAYVHEECVLAFISKKVSFRLQTHTHCLLLHFLENLVGWQCNA